MSIKNLQDHQSNKGLTNCPMNDLGQRNIMKMGKLNICKPRGNPPQKLEDETNTSGLEMKEHNHSQCWILRFVFSILFLHTEVMLDIYKHLIRCGLLFPKPHNNSFYRIISGVKLF